MKNFTKINIYPLIPLIFLLTIATILLFYFNFSFQYNQQFSELANSFLQHKFFFLNNSPYNQYISDNVYFKNHYYWPLGPFPAIALMPFIQLGHLFNFYFFQGYLNFFLVLLIFYLIFKLARKIDFSPLESIYLSTAFILSSMFLGVAVFSFSWYFAQTIVVLLLFLALLEYFGKKRYFLIGLIFGLILLSRVTASIGILFFLADTISEKNINPKIKIQNTLKLAIIPAICLILLGGYNYVRFNNPFDQGYRAQILDINSMHDKNNYGLFNLKYLPRGIYYSLINIPEPVFNTETHLLSFPFVRDNRWGLSIFLTSPYLLYLFFTKIKKKREKLLILTSILIWLTIAASFFTGYIQFGFRYALDFMPLLFTAFMIVYKKSEERMSNNLKMIIIISAIFNFYLLLNI